jgi:uncharacterized repeat protein (TIGR03803 family)
LPTSQNATKLSSPSNAERLRLSDPQGAQGHDQSRAAFRSSFFVPLHYCFLRSEPEFSILARRILNRDGGLCSQPGPDHGGTANDGVLYKVTPGGTYTVLHEFQGGSDGQYPVYPLIEGSDGSIYGVTTGFVYTDVATVFKYSSTGG